MYLNNVKPFFVHGGVDAEDRERVREITEKENNAIIVAHHTELSLLVSILSNLHNVIFASPIKVAYTKSQSHRKSAP